jgi:hypothetical protein
MVFSGFFPSFVIRASSLFASDWARKNLRSTSPVHFGMKASGLPGLTTQPYKS